MKISVEATDIEIKIVETYVPNAQDWLNGAWKGKVSSTKDTLIKEEITKSLLENSAIPSTEDGIIQKAFARLDYKTWAEKDIEEKEKKDKIL